MCCLDTHKGHRFTRARMNQTKTKPHDVSNIDWNHSRRILVIITQWKKIITCSNLSHSALADFKWIVCLIEQSGSIYRWKTMVSLLSWVHPILTDRLFVWLANWRFTICTLRLVTNDDTFTLIDEWMIDWWIEIYHSLTTVMEAYQIVGLMIWLFDCLIIWCFIAWLFDGSIAWLVIECFFVYRLILGALQQSYSICRGS